jgi:hypothetical protein
MCNRLGSAAYILVLFTFPLILTAGVSSCVVIPYVPHSEVSVSDDVHTPSGDMIVTLGPPELIEKLSETIANTDGMIRIYDSEKLRDEIFPDGDTRVTRLINDVNSLGYSEHLEVDFLVLVGKTEKMSGDLSGKIHLLAGGLGGYAGAWGAAYNKEKIRLSAIIIDLHNKQPILRALNSHPEAMRRTSSLSRSCLLAMNFAKLWR